MRKRLSAATVDGEVGGRAPDLAAAHAGAQGEETADGLGNTPNDLFLRRHHLVCLLTDRALVVRSVLGVNSLIDGLNDCSGKPLVEAAPELARRGGELQALLAGQIDRMDVGLVLRADPRAAGGGRYLWAQTTARCNEAGEVVGVCHMLAEATSLGERLERMERQRRELSELRQRVAGLNMEVALAQSELRRLDEAKSQFVSAAAHELRNPLASLLGYLELIEMEGADKLSEAQRDYLSGVNRSAQRLRTLTSNLLDITRIDSNRLELTMSMMDPLELLETAAGEMQPLFEFKKQRAILKADAALPRIWCDRNRAVQILINLLSNAHKYTPQGGSITMQVSRVKNKPMVCFRIKDTGIGIPADEQYQLFTRFYRASNATNADGSGAGLGLAITQSLVRLHGGKIWFESKEGKGTSFFVTFPIAD